MKNGVAHRDVKPDNMLIDPATLTVKIIDFGLGSFIRDEQQLDTYFVGTPIYMSPQQLAKGTYKVVASDLWSVGVTLLELLTGKNPLRGSKTHEVPPISFHSFNDIFSFKAELTLVQEVQVRHPNVLKWDDQPRKAQILLNSLLNTDEAARISMTELQNTLDRWHAREKLKNPHHQRRRSTSRRNSQRLSQHINSPLSNSDSESTLCTVNSV